MDLATSMKGERKRRIKNGSRSMSGIPCGISTHDLLFTNPKGVTIPPKGLSLSNRISTWCIQRVPTETEWKGLRLEIGRLGLIRSQVPLLLCGLGQ